jgi:hypothetical protein
MISLFHTGSQFEAVRYCRVISFLCAAFYLCVITEAYHVTSTNDGRSRRATQLQKKHVINNMRLEPTDTFRQYATRMFDHSVVSPQSERPLHKNNQATNELHAELLPSQLNVTSPSLHRPMSDLQMMALKSNIGKFIVPRSGSLTGSDKTPNMAKKSIVLWRNFLDSTQELTGYPIAFLSEQMKSMLNLLDRSAVTSESTVLVESMIGNMINKTDVDWDLVVPYIDTYTFELGGGVSGLVFGVAGVADGTRICTSPVVDVQTTIPRNFIETGDGCLYELGRPAFSSDLSPQSSTISGVTKQWFRSGKETASVLIKNSASVVNDNLNDGKKVDSELFQLGALTTLLLTGASVVENLSHHLTVNVFWV